MKKLLLSVVLTAVGLTSVSAEELQKITLNSKEYTLKELVVRQEGPGITYRRIRIPDYPLNVNMMEVDLTNPYNRIETMQASETLYKTETLANAYKRYNTDEKRVIGGANANFWCVSSQQPYSDLLIGATYNGNLRNGQIITETNAYSDQWDGGPARTGVIAIDTSKKLYVESMNYKGYVKNSKIGNPEIIQVNKIVRDEEIGLYNSFYGSTKSFMPADQYKENDIKHFKVVSGVATEVYLTINDGQRWMAGQDMTCTVAEVKTDAGTGKLGSYDLCLVGRGSKKTLLAQLAVGDQVTINYGWTTADGSSTPIIEQLVGGNAIVMKDGVLTGRNTDETYNSQVYSRTGYGSSADGKKLYIIVIDKSLDGVYGNSAGCGTSVMCEILKYYGCDDVVTMDAGGSAQMMLHGKVINTTTESSPRSVANGWFVYSIAPQDNVIARLAFAEKNLIAPPYSSYSPKILGYNQYGDLIDDDVQGFTLSCDATIGTCDGMIFTAGGTATTGQLTATYNGISVTETMEIVGAEISIRIKPTILIDANREYPMEVTATVGTNIYSYNPASIEWSVEDVTIASIDANGVLRGLSEGTTKITGRIGDFVDETNVTVEIADGPKMYPANYSNWTITNGSGVSNTTMSSDGVLSLTYKSARGGGSVTMNSDVVYYSLPDKLWLDFTGTVPLTKIIVGMRANGQALKEYTILPESGSSFSAGESHKIELPISTVGEAADLSIYPISLNSILCYIPTGSSNSGNHTITINELSAEYGNYQTGVESVKIGEPGNQVVVYPNPVTNGTFAVKSNVEIKDIEIYAMSGIKVVSKQVKGSSVVIDTEQLSHGIYIVVVKTLNGVINEKLVIE